MKFLMKMGLVIGLYWLLTVPALSQIRGVERISIVSSGGWSGESNYNELVIEWKSASYYANGEKVPSQLISALLAAVNAPVITKLNLTNLGITQDWLNANARKGLKEYAEAYFNSAAPNQQALFLSSFKNPSFIEKTLRFMYWSFRTHDYPEIRIEIIGTLGRKSVVSSDAQHWFMLPWHITRQGRTIKTYNADISRAIANLVPQGFANRKRLSGEGLEFDLAEAVMRGVEDQWNLLEAENKAGSYLEQLRRNYTIESAEINGYHSVGYGGEWVDGNPTEINLHATLRRPEFLKHFSIELILPFKDGSVDNVDLFLSRIESYKRLALSIPWLKEYLASHSDMFFQIQFVNDRSFSEKAMKVFAADMQLGGKESLVKEVADVQKEIGLIVMGEKTYETYWLILPDKRMVLWRFIGNSEVRKWKDKQVPHWECSSYQGDCVGAIVSPNGIMK